jgi:hypothetical protein
MHRRKPSAESIYLLAMQDLVKAGVLESIHQWHELNSEEILTRAPSAAEPVRNFMKLYMDSRFGTNGVSMQSLKHARKELVQASKKAVASP